MSETSTRTASFSDCIEKCYYCRKPIETRSPSPSNIPYDNDKASQLCYTVCSSEMFFVCGKCVLDQALKKEAHLIFLLSEARTINEAIREYRSFQKSHLCDRSVSEQIYLNDFRVRKINRKTFELYMSMLPQCETCEQALEHLNRKRGPWKSFKFVSPKITLRILAQTRYLKKNFLWTNEIHKAHANFCPNPCRCYDLKTSDDS